MAYTDMQLLQLEPQTNWDRTGGFTFGADDIQFDDFDAAIAMDFNSFEPASTNEQQTQQQAQDKRFSVSCFFEQAAGSKRPSTFGAHRPSSCGMLHIEPNSSYFPQAGVMYQNADMDTMFCNGGDLDFIKMEDQHQQQPRQHLTVLRTKQEAAPRSDSAPPYVGNGWAYVPEQQQQQQVVPTQMNQQCSPSGYEHMFVPCSSSGSGYLMQQPMQLPPRQAMFAQAAMTNNSWSSSSSYNTSNGMPHHPLMNSGSPSSALEAYQRSAAQAAALPIKQEAFHPFASATNALGASYQRQADGYSPDPDSFSGDNSSDNSCPGVVPDIASNPNNVFCGMQGGAKMAAASTSPDSGSLLNGLGHPGPSGAAPAALSRSATGGCCPNNALGQQQQQQLVLPSRTQLQAHLQPPHPSAAAASLAAAALVRSGSSPAAIARSASGGLSPLSAACFGSVIAGVMAAAAAGEEVVRTRQDCLDRYREKKARRLYTKKIRYQLRKINADKRPRIKGRFVKKEETAAMAAAAAAAAASKAASKSSDDSSEVEVEEDEESDDME